MFDQCLHRVSNLCNTFYIQMFHYMFIISQLWLTSHPRSTVVPLDTGTPHTSTKIYSEIKCCCKPSLESGMRTRLSAQNRKGTSIFYKLFKSKIYSIDSFSCYSYFSILLDQNFRNGLKFLKGQIEMSYRVSQKK